MQEHACSEHSPGSGARRLGVLFPDDQLRRIHFFLFHAQPNSSEALSQLTDLVSLSAGSMLAGGVSFFFATLLFTSATRAAQKGRTSAVYMPRNGTNIHAFQTKICCHEIVVKFSFGSVDPFDQKRCSTNWQTQRRFKNIPGAGMNTTATSAPSMGSSKIMANLPPSWSSPKSVPVPAAGLRPTQQPLPAAPF